jgi:hypothetical protein
MLTLFLNFYMDALIFPYLVSLSLVLFALLFSWHNFGQTGMIVLFGRGHTYTYFPLPFVKSRSLIWITTASPGGRDARFGNLDLVIPSLFIVASLF